MKRAKFLSQMKWKKQIKVKKQQQQQQHTQRQSLYLSQHTKHIRCEFRFRDKMST